MMRSGIMSPAACLALAGCFAMISGSHSADLGFCPTPMSLAGPRNVARAGVSLRSQRIPQSGVTTLRSAAEDPPAEKSRGMWALLKSAKNTAIAHILGAAVLMSPVAIEPAHAQAPATATAPAKESSGFPSMPSMPSMPGGEVLAFTPIPEPSTSALNPWHAPSRVRDWACSAIYSPIPMLRLKTRIDSSLCACRDGW